MQPKKTIMLCLILAILTACQPSNNTGAGPAAAADPQPIADPAAAAAITAADQAALNAVATAAARLGSGATGQLVIYSGRSESLVAPIIAQFAAATGIDVQVRYGDTAELAATLLEEGANSPADLFFAQDPGGLGAVQSAGLLATLPADTLARVPARFAAADGQWVGISGRARVVVYNTETLTPADLPDDMWGFTDPAWQGRIGWAPTNGSFQAMVTAMRSVWGEAQTREWLAGIQANDPIVFEKNTPIV
ncbi:MAG: extracellular solute-binding protein, partial [Anaerolineales bacterium]|nr:extracellular solute-binding protein [Anaerolineales bacterium]